MSFDITIRDEELREIICDLDTFKISIGRLMLVRGFQDSLLTRSEKNEFETHRKNSSREYYIESETITNLYKITEPLSKGLDRLDNDLDEYNETLDYIHNMLSVITDYHAIEIADAINNNANKIENLFPKMLEKARKRLENNVNEYEVLGIKNAIKEIEELFEEYKKYSVSDYESRALLDKMAEEDDEEYDYYKCTKCGKSEYLKDPHVCPFCLEHECMVLEFQRGDHYIP